MQRKYIFDRYRGAVSLILAAGFVWTSGYAQTLRRSIEPHGYESGIHKKDFGPLTLDQRSLPMMLDTMFPDDLVPKGKVVKARVDPHAAAERQNINPAGLATIPHWSDTFTYHGLTYKYTMVGTDPQRGSATTVIPTYIIPMRLIFEDGFVMDASTDTFPDGQNVVQFMINSPMFQPYDFSVGGVNIGNTQYGDAFQRANFWSTVSQRSPDYHVLLSQPTVLPAYDVFVPPEQGAPFHNGISWWTNVTEDFLRDLSLEALQNANVSPETLPIIYWGNLLNPEGYHGVYEVPDGLQTYVVTTNHGADTELSRNLLNWITDPFDNNFTPGWNEDQLEAALRCQSRRVSDKLEASRFGGVFVGNYALMNGRFIDYFTRRTPSRSLNGQYVFEPFFEIFPNSPSPPCTGHLELEMTNLEFPNALRTSARGINNKGWIVGNFVDTSNRLHGFIYDGRNYSQLDHPNSVRGTVASKLNESGHVVGWYFDAAGRPHGFLYFRGEFTAIDFPGSIDNTSIAYGINSRGDIVGLYDATVEITHGFLYRNGQYRVLDAPFGQQAEIRGINDLGMVVGDSYDDPFAGPVHGFSLNGDIFTQFDFPQAFNTAPYAINNLGVQGGIYADEHLGSNGYVRIYGYPYEINGFVLGMNDKGRIVGSRFDADAGRTVGYTATLPK